MSGVHLVLFRKRNGNIYEHACEYYSKSRLPDLGNVNNSRTIINVVNVKTRSVLLLFGIHCGRCRLIDETRFDTQRQIIENGENTQVVTM